MSILLQKTHKMPAFQMKIHFVMRWEFMLERFPLRKGIYVRRKDNTIVRLEVGSFIYQKST